MNVIAFALILTSPAVQTFLPGAGGGEGGDRKHVNSLWLWCTSHRMKGWETGLLPSPTCFFQPPINHSRPKPSLFKINDGDYQQEKRSLARAPKKKTAVYGRLYGGVSAHVCEKFKMKINAAHGKGKLTGFTMTISNLSSSSFRWSIISSSYFVLSNFINVWKI